MILFCLLFAVPGWADTGGARTGTTFDCVILLHGLARTAASMGKIEAKLSAVGYKVINKGYPSRKKPIEELAPLAIDQGLDACREGGTGQVHFVTHSLGGILLRYYLANGEIPELGRTVMLAPPNQGSRLVDAIKYVPGYRLLNGPAGFQLGTDANSVPLSLGPVDFDVGIIAGDRSMNVILSQYLENPDDGKVSVKSAKVEGMADFLVVHRTHPFIMKSKDVIEQVIHFLDHGSFRRDEDEAGSIVEPPHVSAPDERQIQEDP